MTFSYWCLDEFLVFTITQNVQYFSLKLDIKDSILFLSIFNDSILISKLKLFYLIVNSQLFTRYLAVYYTNPSVLCFLILACVQFYYQIGFLVK